MNTQCDCICHTFEYDEATAFLGTAPNCWKCYNKHLGYQIGRSKPHDQK